MKPLEIVELHEGHHRRVRLSIILNIVAQAFLLENPVEGFNMRILVRRPQRDPLMLQAQLQTALLKGLTNELRPIVY